MEHFQKENKKEQISIIHYTNKLFTSELHTRDIPSGSIQCKANQDVLGKKSSIQSAPYACSCEWKPLKGEWWTTQQQAPQ